MNQKDCDDGHDKFVGRGQRLSSRQQKSVSIVNAFSNATSLNKHTLLLIDYGIEYMIMSFIVNYNGPVKHFIFYLHAKQQIKSYRETLEKILLNKDVGFMAIEEDRTFFINKNIVWGGNTPTTVKKEIKVSFLNYVKDINECSTPQINEDDVIILQYPPFGLPNKIINFVSNYKTIILCPKQPTNRLIGFSKSNDSKSKTDIVERVYGSDVPKNVIIIAYNRDTLERLDKNTNLRLNLQATLFIKEQENVDIGFMLSSVNGRCDDNSDVSFDRENDLGCYYIDQSSSSSSDVEIDIKKL